MRRNDREITDIEDIKKILDACKVCRVGMADEDGVYIVPMNFGYCYEDDRLVLYFHGAKEGRKIDMMKAAPKVGFEMDCEHQLVEGETACQYSYYYASVIGNGKAELVEDTAEKMKALGVIMKHQTGKNFEEFETNPKLEKMVAIMKVTAEKYSCKQHVPQGK